MRTVATASLPPITLHYSKAWTLSGKCPAIVQCPCLGRMRRTASRSADHQSGRGRCQPHRENHLLGCVPILEVLRHSRSSSTVRGRAACQRGQQRSSAGCHPEQDRCLQRWCSLSCGCVLRCHCPCCGFLS